MAELREELVQANQLRKQQLVELGLLREEEKQKMQRDHEAEVRSAGSIIFTEWIFSLLLEVSMRECWRLWQRSCQLKA